MRNLCDAAYMSCYVAALPFQAHVYYEIWSIDLGNNLNTYNLHILMQFLQRYDKTYVVIFYRYNIFIKYFNV